MAMWETFHFLRPEWFVAVLPLLLVMVLLGRDKAKGRNWQSVVDAELLPHLLIGESMQQRHWPLSLMTLAGLLAITALAGPVWQKLEQPLFSQESSLVILLDLSLSMDATDVKPSRLARAKLKLKDILERRHEGETALIVYAANAFVVTPLSSDTQTIGSQLSGLTTDLMPAQGSRPDLALARGRALLRQASRLRGTLLLVSDGIEGAPPSELHDQIMQLTTEGYQLLLLGVGSEEGAPVPLPEGGFVKDTAGNIVMASLDTTQMQQAAIKGGGIYQTLSADERDIDVLLAVVDQKRPMDKGEAAKDMVSDQWQEEGAWLLLPLILIALFSFRKGLPFLALVMVLPIPGESVAAELWLNQDQQAQQAFDKGDSKAAAELYENREWRAAAHYRDGDYQKALDELGDVAGAEAAYNRGNALAQMGRMEEALKAYDETVKLDPKMEDAVFNRDKVKEWLKESEQQGDKNDSGEQSGDPADQSDEQKGDSESEQSDSGEEQGDSSSEGEPQEGDEASQSSQSDEQQNSPESSRDSDGEEATEEKSAEQQATEQSAAEQLAEQLADAEADEPDEETGDTAQSEKPALQNREERELEQATEQWLRRIPDDPSGLWRRKFLHQYKNQEQLRGEEEKPW